MKPQLLKISNPLDYSFNLFEQECPYFGTPWHYHPEVEIVLVQESEGEKYIGSSITEFSPGDLTMIGSYVPHYYKNYGDYYEGNPKKMARSTVLHFNEDFLGDHFLDAPENKKIQDLIINAKRGILFHENVAQSLKKDFAKLSKTEGLDRLLLFLSILNELSKAEDMTFLTTDPMQLTNHQDSNRIKKVFEHVMQNFNEDIKLSDVASLANMSESAFSRYFKKRTRKTFSTFLTEIRIEHACKLLQKDHHSVSEVSYESGFNNLSNFNRQFKSLKNTTPLNYRARFLG
ncbi:AraC family transcriptional regulator [Jiulongibacter sediminis]|uniref:AraC family transcriptional regulator n=1 Tax=Jiulongibacter sediminis TaxID=1605367 RepID=UPI0026E9F2A5|nr:AraC family transcriptional regulator [Jiulongibacter sediminis]